MANKRNRITAAMSQTIAESSPLIKKTKVLSTDAMEEGRASEISLSQLKYNPFQPRIDINMHSLNELISSIEQNGLMQPIVVTELQDNGLHTIVAGHRRFEAFKIMGKEKIPATIMKELQEKDLAILSLTENLMRENLHPIENAIAIKNILDNNIVESQNKLAEYVGFSKGYVSKLMAILKLPSTIIQKIKSENYKDINVLILINKLKDEKEMLEAYDAVKELARQDAEKYIKSNYFSKKVPISSFIDIKNSKNKISFSIDLKKLSDEQIKSIQKEIESLNNKLLNLSSSWSSSDGR
jgi:ParB family chromosome partitioning protein